MIGMVPVEVSNGLLQSEQIVTTMLTVVVTLLSTQLVLKFYRIRMERNVLIRMESELESEKEDGEEGNEEGERKKKEEKEKEEEEVEEEACIVHCHCDPHTAAVETGTGL